MSRPAEEYDTYLRRLPSPRSTGRSSTAGFTGRVPEVFGVEKATTAAVQSQVAVVARFPKRARTPNNTNSRRFQPRLLSGRVMEKWIQDHLGLLYVCGPSGRRGCHADNSV
jgi:hypothetical protein